MIRSLSCSKSYILARLGAPGWCSCREVAHLGKVPSGPPDFQASCALPRPCLKSPPTLPRGARQQPPAPSTLPTLSLGISVLLCLASACSPMSSSWELSPGIWHGTGLETPLLKLATAELSAMTVTLPLATCFVVLWRPPFSLSFTHSSFIYLICLMEYPHGAKPR